MSVAFSSSVSKVVRSIPKSANAWSVGANTVNGPSPCRVETNPACAKAATKAVWFPVPEATVGMSSAGGVRTLSITWIIPFEAGTSARVTLASLTMTPCPTEKVRSSPLYAPTVMPSVKDDELTEPTTT